MEIEILMIDWIVYWFVLATIGIALLYARKDVDKVFAEAHFIMTKGTFFHKVTYIVIAFILLPFTIPYSIKQLLKKK